MENLALSYVHIHIITFATGISMEELRIRGFHIYQDNWTAISLMSDL